MNEIVPVVLGLARQHQKGRGTEDVPTGTFSEYWFRTSGLYDLNRDGVDQHSTKGLVELHRSIRRYIASLLHVYGKHVKTAVLRLLCGKITSHYTLIEASMKSTRRCR